MLRLWSRDAEPSVRTSETLQIRSLHYSAAPGRLANILSSNDWKSCWPYHNGLTLSFHAGSSDPHMELRSQYHSFISVRNKHSQSTPPLTRNVYLLSGSSCCANDLQV
jgi:hypothetical protein